MGIARGTEDGIVCGWEEGGRKCARILFPRQTLLNHARRVIGTQMLSPLATICNECVRCGTVLSTRVMAYRHLESSIQRGALHT